MKKTKFLFVTVAICSILLAFVSCKKDDIPNLPSKEKYTLIFYGVGGANLDSCLIDNLWEMVESKILDDINANVSLAGVVKFSAKYQEMNGNEPLYGGVLPQDFKETFYFSLNGEKKSM